MAVPAFGVSLLILLALLLIPIAAVLLVLGFRGKRVGNLPVCGTCSFDVSGIATSTASKCPECGDLLGGNVKTGRKQKRIWMLVLGFLLLLFPGAVVFLMLFRTM